MGYKYKNSWGKVVDTELKYKYENVNAKHYGEVKEYKMNKKELEKHLEDLYRGKIINRGNQMTLQEKKNEYLKLLDRYYKAEKWFYKQDDSYFDSVEGKKEYKALIGIIARLRELFNEIEKEEGTTD